MNSCSVLIFSGDPTAQKSCGLCKITPSGSYMALVPPAITGRGFHLMELL